jgi:hypothetical protein
LLLLIGEGGGDFLGRTHFLCSFFSSWLRSRVIEKNFNAINNKRERGRRNNNKKEEFSGITKWNDKELVNGGKKIK